MLLKRAWKCGIIAAWVAILEMASGAGEVASGASVTLAWNVDTSPGVSGYRLYEGATTGDYTNSIDVGNSTNATVDNLISGATYYFAVTAYDTNNLESDYSAEVTYTPGTTSSPPSIVLTSPLDGSSYAAPANVTIAASVSANGHAINGVQFFSGTNLLGEVVSAPYTFTATNLGPGSYSLSATAVYDTNATVNSALVAVTVTNSAPAIILTSPASGATFAAPANVTMSASVTANGHTIDKVQFLSGSTLLGESTNAPYAFTLTNLVAGTYGLSATALYDQTGSVASAMTTIMVTNNPATNTPVLPPPWNVADIGSPAASGFASITNGIYNLSGAGVLGGTADQFAFLYQPMTGKGQIRAQLQSQSNTDPGAIAGLMIRETLTAGSEYLFVGVTGDSRIVCIYRDATSTTVTTVAGGTASPPNIWLRLTRRSGALYAYFSTNGGANWRLVASPSFTMATGIYFGFATASGDTAPLNASTFGNATVTP